MDPGASAGLAAARLAWIRADPAARIAADLTYVAGAEAARNAERNLHSVAALLRTNTARPRADAAARVAAHLAHVAGIGAARDAARRDGAGLARARSAWRRADAAARVAAHLSFGTRGGAASHARGQAPLSPRRHACVRRHGSGRGPPFATDRLHGSLRGSERLARSTESSGGSKRRRRGCDGGIGQRTGGGRDGDGCA